MADLDIRLDGMKNELDFLKYNTTSMDSTIDGMEHKLKNMKYKIKLSKFMQKITLRKLEDMHNVYIAAERTMRIFAVLTFILVVLFAIW